MKKIIAVLMISLSIFLIYFFNRDTSVYYVPLGSKDNAYYEDVTEFLEAKEKLEVAKLQFLSSKSGIDEVYKQVSRNVTEDNQAIKNALIKADLVTIYFDNSKILAKEGDFTYVDKEAEKLGKLLKLIRSYCKERIILIGPNDDYSGSLKYLNKVFRTEANKYDVSYIKIEPANDLTYDIMSKINIKAWLLKGLFVTIYSH